MLQIIGAYVLIFNFGKDKRNSNLYLNLNDLKKTVKKRRRCLGLLHLVALKLLPTSQQKG